MFLNKYLNLLFDNEIKEIENKKEFKFSASLFDLAEEKRQKKKNSHT
jgi:hypothetical protein